MICGSELWQLQAVPVPSVLPRDYYGTRQHSASIPALFCNVLLYPPGALAHGRPQRSPRDIRQLLVRGQSPCCKIRTLSWDHRGAGQQGQGDEGSPGPRRTDSRCARTNSRFHPADRRGGCFAPDRVKGRTRDSHDFELFPSSIVPSPCSTRQTHRRNLRIRWTMVTRLGSQPNVYE